MRGDVLPKLPPSGGYENVIIAATDVFPRYAFAKPVSSPTAVSTAKVLTDILARHAYLPSVLITDKGSVFVSNVIHKIADVLGITFFHATTKHPQTMGVLERKHAMINTSLKVSSGEILKQEYKDLFLAIFNY